MDPLLAVMLAGLLVAIGGLVYLYTRFLRRPGPTRRFRPARRRELPEERQVLVEAGDELSPRDGAREARPAPEGRAKGRTEEDYYLSPRYGDGRIVIMARDPHWIFAYWDLAPEGLAGLHLPGSYPALRVYDVTGIPLDGDREPPRVNYYDVPVNEEADNWYLQVNRPDHTLFVEIGRKTADGRFIALARSNLVTMPRDRVSEIINHDWPPLEFSRERAPGSPEFIIPRR